MDDDQRFAQHLGVRKPIIIGGPDHTTFDETVRGARIIKTGYDAHHTAIIDTQRQNKTTRTLPIVRLIWSPPHVSNLES
jgi:hypothetical protein